MNSKVSTSKTTFKKWLKRFLFLLALLILIPTLLFTIGWFNRDRILTALENRYAENTASTLSIGTLNASFINGFPDVGFTLKDIVYTRKDSVSHQVLHYKIEEANLVISAGKLLKGDFRFKKVVLKNGVLKSEVVAQQPVSYYEELKQKKDSVIAKDLHFPDWLDHNNARVVVSNVRWISRDSILKKSFDIDIHHFKVSLHHKKAPVFGESTLDATINHLAFNTDKGSFLRKAHLKGAPKFTADLSKNQITISEFPLRIDRQNFLVKMDFHSSTAFTYSFQLTNKQTQFSDTKKLLAKNIRQKLSDYKITQPFPLEITIEGEFGYKSNPDISAHFSTKNNKVLISDRFRFSNVDFSASFTNDIYQSDSSASKKTTKDFKLSFKEIHAHLEGVKVTIEDAYFQSTPEILNFFDAHIHLQGKNSALAKIIKTDNFDFEGGDFEFKAHIHGDIPQPYEFLNKATGRFSLKNTQVRLKKNGLQLPIASLAVDLNQEHALLDHLNVNLPNGETILFNGHFTNLSQILSPFPNQATYSDICIISPHLNLNDLLATANALAVKTTKASEDRKTISETLAVIYGLFQPRFNLNIGQVIYNDVAITDVSSQIELKNAETLLLHNFQFKYQEAQTQLSGNVKIYGPDSSMRDAIFINAKANAKGSLQVFQNLFKIKLFDISGGEFKFTGNVYGNIKEFNALLNNASGDLTLLDTRLHYGPTDLDIVVDSLSLKVADSNMYLKKFNLEIDELPPITLDGTISDFPNFLLDQRAEKGAINVKVSAPFMDADALLNTFQEFTESKKYKKTSGKKALHTIFKDINRFNPQVHLAIDSLKYKDLFAQSFKGHIYFENDSILKLNDFTLKYNQTDAHITGEINAHISQLDLYRNNPFDLDFLVNVKGKSKDLNAYLKTKNFVFESGDFEFKGNYKAKSADLQIINPEAHGDLKIGNTLVDFKVANLQIPVDSLHVIIDNDLAILKTLDIKLPGKSSVLFTGAIDHFSEFVDNIKDSKQHRSNFHMYSPYLAVEDIMTFFENSNLSNSDRKPFDLQKLKQTLQTVNNSFYPTITIKIDSLFQKQHVIEHFESTLSYSDSRYFNINTTHFEYGPGKIELNMSADIKTERTLPIKIQMQATSLNIGQLLADFNYFGNTDLEKAEAIEGNLNFILLADASLDQKGQLDMTSLNGELQLQLDSLQFKNYKPLVETIPLLRKERFTDLRFQPIIQTLQIKDGVISIPQTEIQSSGIHLFAEGKIKLEDYLNVWLSIPWKNFKRNDGSELPSKTGYDLAGSKFYIQLLQKKKSQKIKNQKLKVKFKLSNRKLRKLREKGR